MAEPPIEKVPDVLFLPMTDWHERTQRTQQLALHLAGMGHRCFLLNPHLGRQYAELPMAARETRLSELGRRIWEIHVALMREPVFHHRLLREHESQRLADELIHVLDRAGTRQLSLIVCLPTWIGCAELVNRHFGGRLLYDCHDLISGFSNMGEEVVAAEVPAMERCHAVMFSARSLQKEFEGRLRGWAELEVVRNGVPEWVPAENQRNSRPVAGYIGAIEDWFDLELMEAAAARLPEVRFLLVGRASEEAIRRMSKYTNVELAGEIPHDQVPVVCASMRIGIIPFRTSRLIDFVDPIKLYEYFHFGLPVVTNRMPELDDLEGLIYQSADADDFVNQINKALAENSEELEQRRKDLARASTWHRRALQVARLLTGSAKS